MKYSRICWWIYDSTSSRSRRWFITALEQKIGAIRPMTELMAGGMDIKRIAKLLYEDMNDETYERLVEPYEILEEKDVKYSCNCSSDKFYRGLINLGKEQLKDILVKRKS